nr:hypothetical protein [Thermocrinis minervae]
MARGELVVGITTSGKVPALSRVVREMLEDTLPQDLEEHLERLSSLRNALPKGKNRQEKLLQEAKKTLKVKNDSRPKGPEG